ncbi:MAG: hypothetical protein WDN75_13405 [Bacteroidota bacterium]
MLPAVFSNLRSRSIGLKGTLRPLLEFESGSNDAMAYFFDHQLYLPRTGAGRIDRKPYPKFFIGMAWEPQAVTPLARS